MGEGPNDSPAPDGRKGGGRGVRASGLGLPPAWRQPLESGPTPPSPSHHPLAKG